MTQAHDTRHCRECGALITDYARQARYCSRECRRVARNRFQRTTRNAGFHVGVCELCGSTFTAPTKGTRPRYCSARCRNRLYLRRHRWATKRRGLLKGPGWWDSVPTVVEKGAYYDALRADPCAYCGADGGELDHIEPRGHGGPNRWHNVTGACRACNSSKQTLPLLLALLAMQIQRDIRPALDELNLIRGVEVRQWRSYAALPGKTR